MPHDVICASTIFKKMIKYHHPRYLIALQYARSLTPVLCSVGFANFDIALFIYVIRFYLYYFSLNY